MKTFETFKADIEKDLEELAKLDVTGAAEALNRVKRGKHDATIRDAMGSASKDSEISDMIIQLG